MANPSVATTTPASKNPAKRNGKARGNPLLHAVDDLARLYDLLMVTSDAVRDQYPQMESVLLGAAMDAQRIRAVLETVQRPEAPAAEAAS